MGAPVLPIHDAIFCACFKVYSTVSARRFMTDLREAQAKGFILKTPHFNTIFNYLEDKHLTPILRELITRSSLPLKAVETDFAVDSSGFSTSRFVRWFDHKYGVPRREHDWVKVHLMCGVRTQRRHCRRDPRPARGRHQIAALPSGHDCRELRSCAKCRPTRRTPARATTMPLIGTAPRPSSPSKRTHTGRGSRLWEKMFHHFSLHREDFLAHYHKRSNVECTFSMIKAKFRDHVRSKTPVAMVNEVLCKIICHNICVLIHEAQELGINVAFRER